MTDLFEPTKEEKRACIERELGMRRSVYPRWVDNGRMTKKKADNEIRIMEAVLKDYE
ncbi:MAG: hypothetical protein AAGA36_00085 [Pseudomonadota bacterium]